MDRTFAYPSMQPTDTLWLNAERNKMIAIGYLSQGVLGTNTVVDGLSCSPTAPATLSVNIGPGSIYTQEPMDSVAYGSLGADSVDQIIKQGIILSTTTLTLTPPSTSGQSINYLIEAEFAEIDSGAAVLSYFNSATPTIPFTGPLGTGSAQPTVRSNTVTLTAKAGVAATAGTQVTPTPDGGYVGLWVVTVAYGATQITSAQISLYPAAPFISVKLPNVPNWVQSGTYAWANDTGTANAVVVNLFPVPTTINAGFEIWFKKFVTSTGAGTITVNGATPVAMVNIDGSALLSSTPMNAGVMVGLKFDGTSWRWMNPNVFSAVGALTAQSGVGINVNGTTEAVSLSYPSLSTPINAQTSADLWSYYSQADSTHRVLSWSSLLASISASISSGATTAQTIAGALANVFVTPSSLAGGLAGATSGSTLLNALGVALNNLMPGGSGWQTIPGGYIIQWGYQANTSGVYNFPTAYSIGCQALFATNSSTQGQYVDNAFGYPINNSQFYLATKSSYPEVQGNNSGYGCYWFAIGK